MLRKTNDKQDIYLLLEKQLKEIERQLKEYDKNILKILKRLNYQEPLCYNQYAEDVEIKVRSYMDADLTKG
ncbi:MAG: hypothetical protein UR61_C0021G0005 [candidate division WS6 bacterium GW2011_GWE1_34_7]|uniref:Uncharacterized protein n=1 Tax=candidate division WS6 bacterium GW2011_GWE1_34_7 TaxID=1619093 RepID=A0A0G0B7W7_9BACT|nr:MAG: hypothetical protein UR61_C0021G0005 [candidate division WS6 bacterium GW2011_GWE1_34_7]